MTVTLEVTVTWPISGHATLGLPQIMLESEGDEIYATGVMGLIFGYYNNRVDPTA